MKLTSADGRNSKTVEFSVESHDTRFVLRQVFATELVGGTTWRGAQLMCNFLLAHDSMMLSVPEIDHLRGRKRSVAALELGAGCGLVSLVASRCVGWAVWATDDAPMIPLLAENVQRNSKVQSKRATAGTLHVDVCPWGAREDVARGLKRSFDVIICSEVLYDPELVDPLIETILMFATPSSQSASRRQGTCVLLSNDSRDGDASANFFRKMTKYFSVRRLTEDELVLFAPDWIPPRSAEEGLFVLVRNDFTDYRVQYCQEPMRSALK